MDMMEHTHTDRLRTLRTVYVDLRLRLLADELILLSICECDKTSDI